MVIDYTGSLKEIARITDLWCEDGIDAGGLVSVAEIALRAGSRYVAVPASCVNMMWSWLEGKGIEILGIIDAKNFKEQRANSKEQIGIDSRLAEQIHSVLKKGADAVILPGSAEMISALLPVRHDLFFEKKLFMTIDLESLSAYIWPDIFHDLKKINVDGIILFATGANATGKIYGMLSAAPMDFTGKIMVLSDSPEVMENALRLMQKIRPELAGNLRFFVNRS